MGGMVERIESDGKLIALIIRGTAIPQKTVFATTPESEMQTGLIVFPAGASVAPHRHPSRPRAISTTSELILVRKGRCEVDMFAEDRRLVATRELGKDDLVLLLGCGHGFRMLEDTVLLEVKQGPYSGAADKELLT